MSFLIFVIRQNNKKGNITINDAEIMNLFRRMFVKKIQLTSLGTKKYLHHLNEYQGIFNLVF